MLAGARRPRLGIELKCLGKTQKKTCVNNSEAGEEVENGEEASGFIFYPSAQREVGGVVGQAE